jgi:hypothetical protein
MSDNAPQKVETAYKPKCGPLPDAPSVPEIPERGKCPQHCDCPPPPGGPPSSCLEDLIRCQNVIVKKADRAKAFAEELTAVQGKVTSAQADYTRLRFEGLRQMWKDQDKAIEELVRKLVCAVKCWECLLACRLCPQLVDIRALEDRLNGTGILTKQVYSLFDLQAWHEHNVADMQSRVERIKLVLTAWEKPSDTLGDVLEKNAKLIEDTQKIIATDSAKAVYDVFMTLLPRHWSIRPRDYGPNDEWKSKIDPKYFKICECKEEQTQDGAQSAQQTADRSQQKQQNQQNQRKDDGGQSEECGESEPDPERCQCDDGVPDDCCGPDVGILNLRQRLIGPLPYIVDPTLFPEIICCLTRERLSPASDQLAAAQAELDATTAEIELVKKKIEDKKSAIEATFRAELGNPIECGPYNEKKPTPATGNTQQTDQTAR